MNKTLKTVLLIINLVGLLVASYWFSHNFQYAAFLVALTQLSALVTILFEGKFSTTSVKEISDSSIHIDTEGTHKIQVEDVKSNSDISIKNR